MATDAEARKGQCDADGVVKGGPAGHQRGRGEGAGQMQFGYGAVDAGSEAKVVSVENQARGHEDGCCIQKNGGQRGTRTPDILLVRQAL